MTTSELGGTAEVDPSKGGFIHLTVKGKNSAELRGEMCFVCTLYDDECSGINKRREGTDRFFASFTDLTETQLRNRKPPCLS